MKPRSVLLVGGLLAVTKLSQAQGHFSFDAIPGVDLEPTVQIDLNPAMLGFLSEAAKGQGEEAAAALEGLTNVRVTVYEGIGGEAQDLQKFVDDTSRTLESQGWHAAVRVREESEQVRIYMKPAAAGGVLEGLTLMVTDNGPGDEAVFINIAGAIQPAQLGKIAAAIGMNGMFSMVPGAGAAQSGADQADR
jgi:hypothetical protein